MQQVNAAHNTLYALRFSALGSTKKEWISISDLETYMYMYTVDSHAWW